MNEIVVLSGKGGTGKTSIVGSLAALVRNKVLADCDVDAADLHLLLSPTPREEHQFWSGQVAYIDPELCTECGLCQQVCRYDAIHDFQVDPIACEGCAFCSHICPAGAIQMKQCLSGGWYISDTRFGPLVHARLGIAQENSGKLVALVRERARDMADQGGYDYVVSDGPPGIGCPVISSLSGAHLALLVAEPTLSGIHDLERVVVVARHFGVPVVVCINKYDLNEENSAAIEQYCHREQVPLAARIPFDNAVTESLVRGVPVVEYTTGAVAREIESLWKSVSSMLKQESHSPSR
ncbi:MAG: ATP-binding protein [Chloroflexota bacterium]